MAYFEGEYFFIFREINFIVKHCSANFTLVLWRLSLELTVAGVLFIYKYIIIYSILE